MLFPTRHFLFWKLKRCLGGQNSMQKRGQFCLTIYTGIHPSGAGFQPTYEELKRFHLRTRAITLWCFQPTYEELKRFKT